MMVAMHFIKVCQICLIISFISCQKRPWSGWCSDSIISKAEWGGCNISFTFG